MQDPGLPHRRRLAAASGGSLAFAVLLAVVWSASAGLVVSATALVGLAAALLRWPAAVVPAVVTVAVVPVDVVPDVALVDPLPVAPPVPAAVPVEEPTAAPPS